LPAVEVAVKMQMRAKPRTRAMTVATASAPVIRLDQIHLLPVAPVLPRLLLMLKQQHLQPHAPAVIHGFGNPAPRPRPRSSHRQSRRRRHPVLIVNQKFRRQKPAATGQLQDLTYGKMLVLLLRQ
jgi:hypothetical protein